MGMESTLKSSVLIGIFVVSIMTFAILFAANNGSDISIASDERFTGLNSTVTSNFATLKENANTSQGILDKTSLASGDQEISGGGGQFKIGPWTAWSITTNSLNTGFDVVFGPEFKFILVAFVSLFVFLIGYYIIKAWLGRDPGS